MNSTMKHTGGLFGGALLSAGIAAATTGEAGAQCAAEVVATIPTNAYEVSFPGFPDQYTVFSFNQVARDGDRLLVRFQTDAYSDFPDYVRRIEDQLLTFDVSDPISPQLVGRWQPGARLFTEIGYGVAGDVLALPASSSTTQVALYDFGDPDAPTPIGTLQVPETFGAIYRVTTWGDKVIAGYTAFIGVNPFPRVVMFDVSDPANPAMTLLDLGTGFDPVLFTRPVDGVLPVVFPDRVMLVDVRGTEPVLLGVADGTFEGRFATIVRDTLVVRGPGGIVPAFDISDPANPTPLTPFNAGGGPEDFTSFEQLVTYSRGPRTDVVDYTDPSNPVVVSTVAGGIADAVGDERGFVFRSGGGVFDVVATGECATPTILDLTQGAVTDEGGDPITLAVEHLNGSIFQWMRDGVPISDDPPYTGTATPTLTIDADLAATGVYSVSLTNASGSVAVTGDAFVGVRPGGCVPADLAPPFGILDLTDINTFTSEFLRGCN